MLKFRGHHFFGDSFCVCCVADERMISVDPTGTQKLRTAFNSALAIKWRGLRVLARRMIVDQDILSLGAKGLMAIANPAIQGGSTRTQMFQRWFDYTMTNQVIGDGAFMREYIGRGYEAGQAFADGEIGRRSILPLAGDRQATLAQLALVELQGIAESVSQGAVRAVANGLLQGKRPASISRDVLAVIDRVGVPRSTALVELIVVKAFSEATLDVYASAGVKRVGLVPETLIASTRDARRVTPTGKAGTRSRRGEGPGIRTIQRIRQHEREVERVAGALVQVKTAGDKRVCQRCRGIAKRGPYRINKARGLIPAHPRCRCVFVPVFSPKQKLSDTIRKLGNGKYRLYSHSGENLGTFETLEAAKKHEREVQFFKHRDEFNPNQPRDPDGKWTSGGGSTMGNKGKETDLLLNKKLNGSSAERVAMRNALKNEADPAKRQLLKQRILDSFKKQYDKTGSADVLMKMQKYEKQYGMKAGGASVPSPSVAPPSVVAPPPPKPIVLPKYVESPPPAPQFSPEETATYKELTHLGSVDQAKTWMRAAKAEIEAGNNPHGLSHSDIAHIKAYTGAGYRKSNSQLRNGSIDEHTFRHTRNLERALEKLPPHRGTVGRKTELTAEQFALYKPGMIVQERAFTSTSKSTTTWSGSTRYMITSKTGRDVSSLSMHKDEDEVLFKPNTAFKITRIEGKTIYMEEFD